MSDNIKAKNKEMTRAVKIFGALEGLRPSALILAKLPNAKTPQGPKTPKPNIKSIARFRFIDFTATGSPQ
jgi:hypothetical protein